MPVIYPGTFDPVTKSHLEIIKRSIKIFGEVIVGVAADSSKTRIFPLEKRVNLLEEEVIHLSGVKVMAFHGLLVDFAKSQNIKVIVRGLRALSDFEYEFKMSYMNNKLNSEIETIFIPATEKENFISSSFVKEIAKLGGDTKDLVSTRVAHELKTFYSQDIHNDS